MLRRDEREIEIVEGRERANQRSGQFRPEKSIWVFNPAERNDIPRTTGDDSPDARYLKSGVDFRVIYLVAAAAGKSSLDYFRWMTDQGGRIRATPSLPMKMLLFDGSALVLPLNPEELSLRTIRRMAAKLGEQAGASGRFGLGFGRLSGGGFGKFWARPIED